MTLDAHHVCLILSVVFFFAAAVPVPWKLRLEWVACACFVLSYLV
jgi:hypothetical protein